MNVRLIRLAEPARADYDRFFEDCPGAFLQQSSWWAEVIAEFGPDEPFFLLAEEAGRPVAALPLYYYSHPLGAVLTSVPQAGPLGGVFLAPNLPAPAVTVAYIALLAEAVAVARARDCLALSLITHPFVDDLPLYRAQLAPDYIFANFTQYIDLREHFDADGSIRLSDYHRRSNLSRNLNKARGAGFRARFCTDPSEIDRLHLLHAKRHAEIGAPPLDARLLRNIAQLLVPRGKAFFLVLESDIGVASWAVYLLHREVLDVLRLNMDSTFAANCPNFLNTDESLHEARRRGVTFYNWQSAPGRTSGVYRYKQQWGSRESTYYYVTKLFKPFTYLEKLGLDTLKREYPLHFIAPYAAAPTFTPGFYRKE
jgi:Acetyltransferase (GNAT) domain